METVYEAIRIILRVIWGLVCILGAYTGNSGVSAMAILNAFMNDPCSVSQTGGLLDIIFSPAITPYVGIFFIVAGILMAGMQLIYRYLAPFVALSYTLIARVSAIFRRLGGGHAGGPAQAPVDEGFVGRGNIFSGLFLLLVGIILQNSAAGQGVLSAIANLFSSLFLMGVGAVLNLISLLLTRQPVCGG